MRTRGFPRARPSDAGPWHLRKARRGARAAGGRQVMRRSESVVGRGRFLRRQRLGYSALDAYPVELASNATLGVDRQRAGQPLRIDRNATLKIGGDSKGVVSEREQPSAAAVRIAVGLRRDLA